jgi:signal transduction histidine kinase
MDTALSLPPPETGAAGWLSLAEALGSAEDAHAAASAAGTWLTGLLGPGALVAVWLPDGAGRLGGVWRNVDVDPRVWPDHAAERRHAFETMRSTRRVPPHGRADHLIAIVPLPRSQDAVGVLEVLATAHRIEAEWEALEAVAGQLGLALHAIEQRERLEQRIGELEEALGVPPQLTSVADGDAPVDLDLRIAWTAHELRGPLSALRTALGFLREQAWPAPHKDLLDRCVAELDHMSHLVDATLRWGTGAASASTPLCDVVDVVGEAIEQAELEFGADRVVFVQPLRATARVEAIQLRCAIGNLIRNALAYSPSSTLVEVELAVEADVVAVTVRNAGRAVSEDDRESIFLPHVRGASAEGRSGSGLGLYIARRVAEANGGRLTLILHEQATDFRLEIPRAER